MKIQFYKYKDVFTLTSKSDGQIITECVERIRQAWKPYTSNELRKVKYRYHKRMGAKKKRKGKMLDEL